MNDFTKEELSTIDYLIDSYCVHSWPPEGSYGPLKTKIQSLIDSYCEHTWTDGSGNSIYCATCNKYGGNR